MDDATETAPDLTVDVQPFELHASDGYLLGATWFRPARASASAPGSTVVVAPATGVPQGFYRAFAAHLAAHGHAVLTFDYRGIGRSRHGSLAGFRADYLDWAERDLGSVVAHAATRAPVAVVGHSFGGHAYGVLPQPELVRGLFTCGTGSGWHGFMPQRERPKVLFMWKVLGPSLTRAYGYLPSRLMGLGEDLPLGVYRQWRRWCTFPRYWFDDPEAAFTARFDAVKTPVVALNATDDAWATPAAASAFMAGYRATSVALEVLEPRAAGLERVGHMGYFRRAIGRVVWPRILRWLDALGA
jgi:predicted alpha/beta hydrolase